MARAQLAALTFAFLTAASDGFGTACGSEGGYCQGEDSISLSMLQRGSEARGRRHRQDANSSAPGDTWNPAWHDCDQPPTAPKTLNLETVGNLKNLGWALSGYPLHECFVTYIGEEADYYNRMAAQPWINTICEVGFNAGHSATLLLSVNKHAKLYSFDLGGKAYSLQAIGFVAKTFPDRFTITVGNSIQTIPRFALEHPGVKCDLIIVDGGHEFQVSRSDIANFQRLANPAGHVLLVDDTRCTREICLGPELAWREAVQAGVVKTLDRQGNDVQGWSVGKYNFPGKSWLQ